MPRWDASQYVGEGQGAVTLAPDLYAEWNYYQWVGEGQGGDPSVIHLPTPSDGLSGNGVSDSGGQRWASEEVL